MEEVQELICHCGRVNTFPVKKEKDGNYIIVCKCGHEHCRVVKKGVVTGIRFDSKQGTSRVKPTERKYSQQQLGRRDPFITSAWLNTSGAQ